MGVRVRVLEVARVFTPSILWCLLLEAVSPLLAYTFS
jgi:hypothetical protein